MAANRPSALNLVLLGITLVCLILAAYGFTQAPAPARRDNAAAGHGGEIAACGGQSPDKPRGDRGRGAEVRRDPSRADDHGGTKPAHTNAATTPTALEGAAPEERGFFDPSKSQPSDNGNAFIAGIVVDSQGKPAGGVTVTARRSDFMDEYPSSDDVHGARFKHDLQRSFEASQRETRGTLTDTDGKFRVSGLDGKRAYDLRALTADNGTARQARVAAGDFVTLILSARCSLSGSVTGPDGKPAQRFTVLVAPVGNDWNAERRAFTSSDGTFSFSVSPGHKRVWATAPGAGDSDRVAVNLDAAGGSVALKLRENVILCGVVTDDAGRPLAEATVSALDPDLGESDLDEMSFSGLRSRSSRLDYSSLDGVVYDFDATVSGSHSARTDTQGRYRIEGLAAKKYEITAQYGTAHKQESRDLKPGENKQDFKLNSGVRVILRVSNESGVPVDAESIWFTNMDGGDLYGQRLPARESGTIEFAGLRPGECAIYVASAGYPTISRKETLKDNVANEFVIKLPRGGNILGRVVGPGDGKLGHGYYARLKREGEPRNSEWQQGRYCQIDTDGFFVIGPVEPGEWNLEVTDSHWQVRHTHKLAVQAGDNPLNLTVDTGGTLKVKVLNEDGSPANWASVLPRNGKKANINGYSDDSGVAIINFVPAGDYRMTVQAQNGTSFTQDIQIRDGLNELSITVKAPNAYQISSVSPDSNAARAGLQPGDIIFEYAGEKVRNNQELRELIEKHKAGESIPVNIERAGAIMTVTVKSGMLGVDGHDIAR